MAWVRAAAAADVERWGVVELIHGEERYAVCKVEGALHAIEGTCPHAGGPLAHGALHGPMLVCPWHAWEFDCRTGQSDFRPGLQLRTFAVEQHGDDVYLDLP